jgi:hypothetical protein
VSEESDVQSPNPQQRSLTTRLTAVWAATRRVPAIGVDRLRRDSALQRRTLLWTIGIFVAVTVVATTALTVNAVTYYDKVADKLVAAGDVLVGATLLLAVIAALVALLAYAVSTGLPDLLLSAQLQHSYPNNPEWRRINGLYWDESIVVNFLQSEILSIFLRNESGYSARNPAVIVRFHAMTVAYADNLRPDEAWSPIDFASKDQISEIIGPGNIDRITRLGYSFDPTEKPNQFGHPLSRITAVQWDGGPTYSIHGHSTRRLPGLPLINILHIPEWGAPALTFEILADGYRKVIKLPVDFIEDEQPRESAAVNKEWL